MELKRSSGILMPISSLPGGYGIGSLGAPAKRFVDFLARAGQTVWQILPVGPTGFADSPYQSCSGFAGNPYLIELDLLARDVPFFSLKLRYDKDDQLVEAVLNGEKIR